MIENRVIPQCPKCRSEGRIFKKTYIDGSSYDYQCIKCYHLYNRILDIQKQDLRLSNQKFELLYQMLHNDELESAIAHKLKIHKQTVRRYKNLLNPKQKGTDN